MSTLASVVIAAGMLENWIERIGKVVYTVEVFSSVRVRFFHMLDTNQVVNNFTKIIGRIDAPAVQDGLGHETELFQCVLANRLTQLLAGDVVFATFPLARHFHDLLGIRQCLTDKLVRLDVVPLVLLKKLYNRMDFF